MKYYFYKNRKTNIVKMYDKMGKNEVDSSILKIVPLTITKTEEKNLDDFHNIKIINNKLVFKELESEIKKKNLEDKITKVKNLNELKQVVLEML